MSKKQEEEKAEYHPKPSGRWYCSICDIWHEPNQDRCNSLRLLQRYQAKACCIHTDREAYQIMKALRTRLTDEEAKELSTEQGHWAIGEGRRMFDAVCEKIRVRIEKEAAG